MRPVPQSPNACAVNEIAPDFVLPGVDGTPVQLSALRGRKVVLFFYPRDESPVCVVQVCAFRDAYEELTSAGVEVVGSSSDSPESHHAFAAHRSSTRRAWCAISSLRCSGPWSTCAAPAHGLAPPIS